MNQQEKYFRKASIHGFYVRSETEVKLFEADLEKRMKEQQFLFRFVTTMKEILRLIEMGMHRTLFFVVFSVQGDTDAADEIVFAEEDIKYLEALKQYAMNETSNNVTVAEQILRPLGIGKDVNDSSCFSDK